MEFEYSSSFYVNEYDLDEMCRLCRECRYSVSEAFQQVSLNWDDCDYYGCPEEVVSQIEAEIARRLIKGE